MGRREPTARSDDAAVVVEIGSVVDTAQGRAEVMDVLDLDDGATVFLRPEHGGIEWTVPLSELARGLAGPADSRTG
jgi:hypothetical protein